MKPCVLIVEDESAIVDNISYALHTEGFAAKWCATGRDGLEAIESGDIALVILDVGLPDTNGFELFKQIKKRADVPVIFLTARSEEIDRVLGLELGADDYVTKPFSPRELAARVKGVLRRFRQADQGGRTPANFPFSCDKNRKKIFYRGQPLELSRYEYNLLELLIGHPGWVFSREQLMERAWDEPDVSLERTIDAHIKNLRQKLKKISPDTDPIVTHHGMGYSLREEW